MSLPDLLLPRLTWGKTAVAQSIAASYVQKWQKLAVSADGSHLTLSVRIPLFSWFSCPVELMDDI